MIPMTLTKTRFKTAMECPRKLDYARDKRYFDAGSDDAFLQSLADGGHQVGELARQMYPGGHLISDVSANDQVKTTAQFLGLPNVTVFEGAIRHGNLLVRCDVLEKRGSSVKLIEVKGKGYDPANVHSAHLEVDFPAIIWRPLSAGVNPRGRPPLRRPDIVAGIT